MLVENWTLPAVAVAERSRPALTELACTLRPLSKMSPVVCKLVPTTSPFAAVAETLATLTVPLKRTLPPLELALMLPVPVASLTFEKKVVP